MKRPKKYQAGQILISEFDRTVYRATDIDPLLDELEKLKAGKNPFPTFEQFNNYCAESTKIDWNRALTYFYFSQFQYEKTVYPKVGDMVEGEDSYEDDVLRKGRLLSFNILDDTSEVVYETESIRHVSTPTREEVIAKYGLTEQELEILKGQDDETT